MGPPTKRRKPNPAVEEITFDLAARQDFLTGFHKRKVQRAKFAQERAGERARQERIEERKKLREERKADLERHVNAVNEMLRPAGLEVGGDGDDEGALEDWNGLDGQESADSPEPVDHEAEFIDEDKYTTVTVETIDVTKDGLVRSGQHNTDSEDNEESKEHERATAVTTEAKPKVDKRKWSKDRPSDAPRKPRKKRNFRYENKTDRKINRAKSRLKNSAQAKARRAE